ncbi:uncharacterized protein LOC125063166 isoform X3 [Pieris napi]|uniref:uncharacterized protein LOC125063166 isoform X3 n=1 Tax=Pieris napi TaxID=78633 RepID=UPI001FBAE5C9|nr:uncharacterized protein LOC125063166 isoform X3 [Pieris napi]
MIVLKSWVRTKTVICVLSMLMAIVLQVTSLSGPNVCTVKQKYNITKRVKYRAPMSVRTYEWCFSIPPRCSRWKTEMRDLTRLETQERTADVAVCCPGYKMKEVSCVPICPNGKTGNKCSEECPPNKWGPNCVNNCKKCLKGTCSPITGDCECLEGWQGESCNIRMTTQPPPALMEEILTTTKSTLQTLPPFTKTVATTKTVSLESTTPVTYNSPIFTKYATSLKTEEITTSTKTTMIVANDAYSNVALPSTTAGAPMSIDTTQTVPTTFVYNRTETPTEEPEHITAVMTDKEREKNSLDLISVVSVVGGIMMAVITVAVIIVMFERCRRPRYDDIRKIHDIQMRAMMGNDDPPPYVRSIFHTPLPEPPRSEKCHYQPISTLDRNLKQFMRPVVVQNISPIMLENFRGILECHYDHLPQRSLEVSARSSIAPSINHEEQHIPRTLAEYTIDALKCEAKLDIIDSTNAEPLYAEIPCWRPPSEHAVEVMNLNGEAVTEL